MVKGEHLQDNPVYLMGQLDCTPYVSGQDFPSKQSIVCWFIQPANYG